MVRQYKGPVRWQHLNPKRINSAAGVRYERYKRSTTFEEARAAGMWKGDRYTDVRQGYVKKGRQLFDGELDSTVRGASASVIALSQGEDASSDGGSSPHEATARSVLLVSSDGSSYASPFAGLVPDTRIAGVSDNATACARCKRNRDVRKLKKERDKREAREASRERKELPAIWQQRNERIVGTPSHARYERYKSSSTLAEAYAAGMLDVDRAVDIRSGYVHAPYGCV
jgi:hypothetical protein